MKHQETLSHHTLTPIRILLADDDRDDCFFFAKELKAMLIPTQLTTVEDGEELMIYLSKNSENLPDVLFMDFNMPKKNGSECLSEIKNDEQLKLLPVIIYSTSMSNDVADRLYNIGAHYYALKTDIINLQTVLLYVLTLLAENKFVKPPREKFILSLTEVQILLSK